MGGSDRSHTSRSQTVKAAGPAAGSAAGSYVNVVKEEKTTPEVWWKSFTLVLLSGLAWVASIPILMVALGGSLQPHVGWPCGITMAVVMFSILVQVDQRFAAGAVLIVSFTSALLAQGSLPLLLAVVATGMTSLNAVKRTCGPNRGLYEFQCRHYRTYHKRSELGGALDSIQPGRSFFACHPHGILSVGWISNVLWSRRFHDLAGRCFYLIDSTLRNKGLFARVFCDAFEGPHGGFRDNSRRTMEQLMERGESVCMIPGAYQEATHFENGKEIVALNERKGFVKYCLRHGYRLHPVYTFGESDTYTTIGGFKQFRLQLNKLGIPTVAFWGLPWCPLAPRQNLELLTFVGPPLELPKIEAPSIEEVNEWHTKYVVALRELFDKHKAEASKPGAVLEVL